MPEPAPVPTDLPPVKSGDANARESVAPKAPEDASMTPFQGVAFGSFVLSIAIAGFAAIALFRRVTRGLPSALAAPAKALGGTALWIALASFYGAHMYANYLWGESDGPPLAATLAAWAIAAPAAGVALSHAVVAPAKPARWRSVLLVALPVALIIASTTGLALVEAGREALWAHAATGVAACAILACAATGLRRARQPEALWRTRSGQCLIVGLALAPILIALLPLARAAGWSADRAQFALMALNASFFTLCGGALLAAARNRATKSSGAP